MTKTATFVFWAILILTLTLVLGFETFYLRDKMIVKFDNLVTSALFFAGTIVTILLGICSSALLTIGACITSQSRTPKPTPTTN